jgi:hypothetical protein
MAAQYPASPQAKTTANAMRANGLLHIIGAGGRVPAAALQAKHDLQRRKSDAVNTDQKDSNRLHEPSSMAKFSQKATRYRRNQ